jgi:hypothetical protein
MQPAARLIGDAIAVGMAPSGQGHSRLHNRLQPLKKHGFREVLLNSLSLIRRQLTDAWRITIPTVKSVWIKDDARLPIMDATLT